MVFEKDASTVVSSEPAQESVHSRRDPARVRVQGAAHMHITERSIGDAIVLDLRGPLFGPETTGRFGAAIGRLARAGRRRVVVNLAEVPSIDAA